MQYFSITQIGRDEVRFCQQMLLNFYRAIQAYEVEEGRRSSRGEESWSKKRAENEAAQSKKQLNKAEEEE